jgi:signal transduction histidine kinase
LLDGSAESLLLLIDDLLDLAQIERGQFALRLAPVKVHDWLVDCADAFKPVADRERLAVPPCLPGIGSLRMVSTYSLVDTYASQFRTSAAP